MKRNGGTLRNNLIRWRETSTASKSMLAVSTALFLSACVSTAPGVPTNLASVLTPDQADKVETVPTPGKELSLSPAQDTTTEAKPAVETALAKTDTAISPAQKAVNSATQTKASTTATDAAKVAADKAKAEAAQQKIEADRKKKNKGLFAAFAKSNEASSQRKRPSADVPKKNKPATKRPTVKAVARNGSTVLPGVRGKAIFGIEDSAKSRDLDKPVKVAAVTNLARRGNHGLLLQRKSVKVGCFPPPLIRILKRVERKFGRTPIVTSGYRSPKYNRLIRGAKNSMHIHCKAADIQVKGVSKWTLARYLRTLPGRGGVGTYCHTASVHIDIGTKRDWNRKCSRKRRRRKT